MKIHDLLNSQTTTTNQSKNITVRNLIILDASGSMSSIYGKALSGTNETLQTIRNAQASDPELTQLVTLASFSTSGLNLIYQNKPAAQAADIASGQYRTSGGTPLYDAIGKCIELTDAAKQPNDSVLVTIITDGEENCSSHFSGPQIKALIESKREQGWVFTYIGANQDVERVAGELSINHSLAFEASDHGTQEMWDHSNVSRRKFYSSLKEKLARSAGIGRETLASDDDFEF